MQNDLILDTQIVPKTIFGLKICNQSLVTKPLLSNGTRLSDCLKFMSISRFWREREF